MDKGSQFKRKMVKLQDLRACGTIQRDMESVSVQVLLTVCSSGKDFKQNGL